MEVASPDRELIKKCLSQDRKAQYQLYNNYSKAMYNICYRMTNDHGMAEDILQSAFVDIFRKLQQFSYQSSIGSWMKRIVVNACIDHLRKKKRYFSEIDERILQVEDEGEVQERDININAIRKAMEELPDGYRVVFSLYAVEGYDHEEIGHILSISEETSKSQYHRARKKLKSIIKEKGIAIIE